MQKEMESEPVEFLVHKFPKNYKNTLVALSKLLNADWDDIVYVPNATYGVNCVLQSVPFKPGDEIIITNQEYNACKNVVYFVAEKTGAKVVVVDLPFPISESKTILEKIKSAMTDRTKLLLIDHITSQTGLVMPIKEIIKECEKRGIESLIDGAHGPGQIKIDLKELNPTYYTGNCHKWLCTPKGSALLYVRKDKQMQTRPVAISHGASIKDHELSRFQLEFMWTGTFDPTAFFTIPFTIDFFERNFEGGLGGLSRRNNGLALKAQKILSDAIGIAPPAPSEMIANMAAIPLAPSKTEWKGEFQPMDPLHVELRTKMKIDCPIFPWPKYPNRILRVSAQAYVNEGEILALAEVLKKVPW
jgi:isopenicillin-N epimerase